MSIRYALAPHLLVHVEARSRNASATASSKSFVSASVTIGGSAGTTQPLLGISDEVAQGDSPAVFRVHARKLVAAKARDKDRLPPRTSHEDVEAAPPTLLVQRAEVVGESACGVLRVAMLMTIVSRSSPWTFSSA